MTIAMSSEEKSDLEASRPRSTLTDVPEATGIDTSVPRQKSWLRDSVTAMRQKMATKVDARIVSDAILGLSDGMTVPFALGAGLTAFGTTRIVIVGGLAELIAGAISMGLGGYLGAQSIS
jgi:VIT family